MGIGDNFDTNAVLGEQEINVAGDASAETETSVAPTVAKSDKDNKVIQAGKQEYTKMTDEEKAVQGNKSATLHFKNLIGLASKKDWRRVSETGADGKPLRDANNKVKDGRVLCLYPVGAEFVSDEDIDVPVIPAECTPESGVTPEQIGSRHVKAGETFALTQLEAMFLLLRKEYGNTCEFNGQPNGCISEPKMVNFIAEKAKLPTPAIKTIGMSSKSFTVQIDDVVRGEDGEVKEVKGVLPGYERFAAFLPKAQAPRTAGGTTVKKPSVSRQVITAAGLRKILGI